MRYYIDDELYEFLQKDVEAVIELIKKAYKSTKEYYEKYNHPLWKESEKSEIKGGHGGMDWLVLSAFFESVKNKTQTPIDVYDTASWMCISALSEQSVALNGSPVYIPDFTCGKWMSREPYVKGKYCLEEVSE